MEKADLHIHSNYSDGSDSVIELIENIKKTDIKTFALTDHDTVDGCKEIEQYIPDNIRFIKGVELTCESDGIECHILGYNCDIYNQTLADLILKGKKLRRTKLDRRINFLKEKWDIELTQTELDWLYSRKSVVKTHVANILVKRGLAEDNVSAMKKYLDGCKSPNTKFTITESMQAIISSGGIPVWAHPLGGEGEVHINKNEFLTKLDTMKNLGIKGLECYYSRYNCEEINMLTQVAVDNSLFITGGSDYHGTNKDIELCTLNSENKPIDKNLLTLLDKI